MHRSGTSCLTGCLEDMGLHLGEVNREAPHNRKGNNENESIRALQDQILARVSCDWTSPPKEAIEWNQEETRAAKSLLSISGNFPVWGFKDPRTLLLLEGWLKLAPDLNFAGTIRHPLEVAASLATRNGFTLETSLGLWVAYNRALLNLRRERVFPIVLYDHNPDRYLDEVRSAGQSLGLSYQAPIKFRDEDLHHHVTPDDPPAETRALWDELNTYRGQVLPN